MRIQVPLMFAMVNLPEEWADVTGARRTLGDVFRAATRKPRTVPSTEVRRHFSGALDWVSETDSPLIVTDHGKPEVVILSFRAFEQMGKGIARVVLALGSRRLGLSQQAEDVVGEDGADLARRFRQGGLV